MALETRSRRLTAGVGFAGALITPARTASTSMCFASCLFDEITKIVDRFPAALVAGFVPFQIIRTFGVTLVAAGDRDVIADDLAVAL